MKNYFPFIFFLLCSFNSLNAQNQPFFIDIKNSNFGNDYYQNISFCSNLNEEEIIYIKNGYRSSPPSIHDYGAKLVKSKKNGDIIKEVSIDSEELKSISAYGVKIGEQFIIMSYMHSNDSFYLTVSNYNEEIQLQSTINYPITNYDFKLVGRFNLYSDLHFAKDDHENVYILLINDLDSKNSIGLSFTSNGDLIKQKIINEKFSTSNNGGFFFDSKGQTLNYFAEDILKYTYDTNYDFLYNLDLRKDNVFLSPFDTMYERESSYINVGSETIRLGRTQFKYSDFDKDTLWSTQGRALSYIDQNGSIKGKVHFTELTISTESDGTPRLSGGLFFRDGYYYTIFEYSSTGFPFPGGNTLIIAKFDSDFNIVSETSFVLDSRYRLFNYWAELTEDNSFIASGFYFNVDPDNPNPFVNSGGFIFGLKADGTPPILGNDNTLIKAIFSVKGNPTRDLLVIETEENKSQQYEVRILDITGKLIKTSNNWNQGRIEISLFIEPPGIYFYNIIEDGKLLTGGKFVKI